MHRAMIAAQVTEKFVEKAKEKEVSIHGLFFLLFMHLGLTYTPSCIDIEYLRPVLLHESPDLDIGGKAWLSDRLINGPMKKYSGTDEAGNSSEGDFAGLTCDALAHWSLTTSGCLFVDIQGKICSII